ncbi:MAG: hypothetical protein HC768_20250 [Acaryochloris sp. CRU_2_0]|nr:hypothetical protein [Acaryochloris sp. CRU_2_0]
MVQLPGGRGNTDVSPALQSQIQSLSLDQLEALTPPAPLSQYWARGELLRD